MVPLLALAVAALALVGVVTHSTGGTEDADQLLQRALSSDTTPKSGRFDADLTLSLAGMPGVPSSPLTMKMDGAFQDRGKAKLPKLDLDLSAAGFGQTMRFGLISTGNSMFVRFDGKHYEVPRDELRRVLAQQGSASQSPALLGPLGMDPRAWVENERVEGTANVGGVETTHVAADIDVGRMLDDVTKLVTSAPRPAGVEAPKIPPDAMAQIRDAVKEAKIDVFLGKQDNLVRRAQLHAAFEAKSPDGGSPVSGDLELDFRISDVNKPVEVGTPGNVRPFSELRPELDTSVLGAGPAGFGAGSGGGSASRAAPAPPAGQQPGAGTPSGSDEAPAATGTEEDAYLGCVEKAETSAELQGCAPLLER
jgi:hypothetical protein